MIKGGFVDLQFITSMFYICILILISKYSSSYVADNYVNQAFGWMKCLISEIPLQHINWPHLGTKISGTMAVERLILFRSYFCNKCYTLWVKDLHKTAFRHQRTGTWPSRGQCYQHAYTQHLCAQIWLSYENLHFLSSRLKIAITCTIFLSRKRVKQFVLTTAAI